MDKDNRDYEGSGLYAMPNLTKEDDEKLSINFSRLKYAIDLIEKGKLKEDQLELVQQFAIDMLLIGLELRAN